jgi:hypothetical protein
MQKISFIELIRIVRYFIYLVLMGDNIYIKYHHIYIEFENKMTQSYENRIHEHKISLS